MIRTSVIGLSSLHSPSAISGLIASMHIDTIEGVMLGRGFAHVGKKQLEVVPSLAKGDASTSVIGEFRGGEVAASLLRLQPRHINLRSTFPVAIRTRTEKISTQAATTARVTTDQIRRLHKAIKSAVAMAYPHRMTMVGIVPPLGDESAKTHSCKLVVGAHG